MMPVQKFLAGPTMAMPGSIFTQTIAGDWPHDDETFQNDSADQDVHLEPDFSTLSVVPWETDPTAQVIHDAYHADGRPVEIAPRQVLRRVIELYAQPRLGAGGGAGDRVLPGQAEQGPGLSAGAADRPLGPAGDRRASPIRSPRSTSSTICSTTSTISPSQQGLEIDTLIHEEGAAQMEINLRHGDPLMLADQVFQFKRTIREAALRHDMYATFMAKPMSQRAGLGDAHPPVGQRHRRPAATSSPTRTATRRQEFFAFIGGSQKYLPAVTCIMAPYVNSYRRLVRSGSAPVNTMWGYDNRTVGLRVPYSDAGGAAHREPHPLLRRQPYLAIAASLACGYLGMTEGLMVSRAGRRVGANEDEIALPRGLLEAVALFEDCEELVEIFGKRFVATYRAIKQAEFETFMQVISPWEREYLLLNV